MKMTKRFAAMAACAVMTITSMVGMSASASDATINDNYVVSEVEQNDNGIARIAAGSKTLSVTVTKQEKSNWCWAACTQAVLNYNGESVSQTDIVTYVKGSELNEGGKVSEMASALNHFLDVTTYSGYTGTIKGYSKIVTKIKLSKPVILAGHYTLNSGATSDHAMLCYGYSSQNSDELKLYVKSPTTTGTDTITLTCSDENATSYDMYRSGSKIGTYTVTGYAAN